MQKLTAIKARALIHDLSGLRTIREELFRQALEIALPVLEQQEKGDDGWLEWSGGECPVDEMEPVQVKFRNGLVKDGRRAASWDWRHESDPDLGDIIAYRVIENDGREG